MAKNLSEYFLVFPLHVDFHLIMYCHCGRDLKTIEDSQLNIKSFCFVSFVLFFWVVGGGGVKYVKTFLPKLNSSCAPHNWNTWRITINKKILQNSHQVWVWEISNCTCIFLTCLSDLFVLIGSCHGYFASTTSCQNMNYILTKLT